jgi:hypothetical protein
MKKIVHYKPHPEDVIVVGRNGYVMEPLDHPGPHVTNTVPVITSRVVHVAEGYFETENTIYARAHFENSSRKEVSNFSEPKSALNSEQSSE